MGGCASKPKDLDTTEKAAPAPIEAPSADPPALAEEPDKAEAVEEKKEDVGAEKTEEPLVDLSEPSPAKVEEAKEETETKPVEEAKEENKVVA